MVRTVISLERLSLTRRSRSIGSVDSRIFWASSSLSSRFDAARSASLAGSSRLAAMTMTSGEMVLPRETDFSRFCFTLRRRASCSGGRSVGGSVSSSFVILTLRYGSSDSTASMRARARPWTRRRMRPSGSFSILMIAATVPTPCRSAGPGVSFWPSFWATSMMMRWSARAASTALMDFSRETERGRMMNGKTTTSFKGRTGRMSGIGRSVSRSAVSSFSSISAMAPYSSPSSPPETCTSYSFSRWSGTRGRMTSRSPLRRTVFASRLLTGRGRETDFTNVPK